MKRCWGKCGSKKPSGWSAAGGRPAAPRAGGAAGSESGQLGIKKNAVEEEVEPPKMIGREKEKRLQRLEEASANLREPTDGKLFCFLTKSQKSLAKLELSNREELKIG